MDEFDIGQAFENAVSKIFEFLPQLLGAIVLLIIRYIVSKVIGGIVRKLLQKARFDRAMRNSAAGNYVARIVESHANFIGKTVFWLYC